MAIQSSTSRPRKARRRKPFSVAEANHALPLVSRIVADIVACHRAGAELQGKLEASRSPKQAPPADIRERLEQTLEKLHRYADELRALGVELKDPQTGLIDFPGRHQGREVFLCWKLGEAKVEYWHDLHSGFSGRQPVGLLDERVGGISESLEA